MTKYNYEEMARELWERKEQIDEIERRERANNNMTEKNWKGFYKYLTEELGLQEAGNDTLDSVFAKAPNKYNKLEKSIGWMLFWKSLENTVSDTPDFRSWSWSGSRSRSGSWSRSGSGSGSRSWSGSGSRSWSGSWSRSGSGSEKPLPDYNPNKSLWNIFYNKHEVQVYFETEQITQFNQILEDYRNFEEKEETNKENNMNFLNKLSEIIFSIELNEVYILCEMAESMGVRRALDNLKREFVPVFQKQKEGWEKELNKINSEITPEFEELREVITLLIFRLKEIDWSLFNERLDRMLQISKNSSSKKKWLDFLNNRISFLENKVEGGTEANNLLNDELSALKNLQTEWKTNFQQKETELNNKLGQLEQEKQELETKLQTSNQELEQKKQELDQANQNLQTEKQTKITLTNSITELREKIKNSTNSNQELQQQKTQAEQQLTALLLSSGLLSTQIAELEQKVNNLEREKENSKNKIANLEQEIQHFLEIKTNLEIENEAITRNVAELKIQVNRQKDQISSLQGEQEELNHQLEILKGELNLSPISPSPETQTLQEKIVYFNDWLRKAQKDKEELEENIKGEREKAQTARTSLLELEEQLKGTSEDNQKQILELNKKNNELRKEIRSLENNLKTEKNQVVQLQQELATKTAEIKKLGITLIRKEQELVQVNQDKQWWVYAFWIVAVVVGLGVGWFTYREIRKRF